MERKDGVWRVDGGRRCGREESSNNGCVDFDVLVGSLNGVGYVGICSGKLLDIVWVVFFMIMSFWKRVASEREGIYVLSIVLYVDALLMLIGLPVLR